MCVCVCIIYILTRMHTQNKGFFNFHKIKTSQKNIWIKEMLFKFKKIASNHCMYSKIRCKLIL